jgi:Rrf2 family nitric oxide-sensitive transcriptional repressor
LTKVVHQLGQLGLVASVRGRNGGLRLGMEPAAINVGAVVRKTESDFHIAECFEEGNSNCIYSASCALKGVLDQANNAFFAVLDNVTLDMLVKPKASHQQGVSALLQPVPLQFRRNAAQASSD